MTGGAGFAARTGHELPALDPETRTRQVAQAWESLLQIRRLVQPDHPDLPAPWERTRPVQAVSLALEASGVDFAGVDEHGTVMHSGVQLTEESRPPARHLDGRVPVRRRHLHDDQPGSLCVRLHVALAPEPQLQ